MKYENARNDNARTPKVRQRSIVRSVFFLVNARINHDLHMCECDIVCELISCHTVSVTLLFISVVMHGDFTDFNTSMNCAFRCKK